MQLLLTQDLTLDRKKINVYWTGENVTGSCHNLISDHVPALV